MRKILLVPFTPLLLIVMLLTFGWLNFSTTFSSNSLGTLSLAATPTIENADKFVASPFPLAFFGLFDLGVADVNGDDRFDIFTTNHNAIQSLLLGSSSGEFQDVMGEWKLAQDPNFPGLDDFSFSPPENGRGFYIYRGPVRELNLRLKEGDRPVKGTITLPSPKAKVAAITVLKKQRADVSITERSLEKGLETTIEFNIQPNGQLVLDTRFPEITYNVKLDWPFPLGQVRVGAEEIRPRNRQFKLRWQDRHGMAWADFQGDDRLDVFMTRGGARGQILKFPAEANLRDELFVNRGVGRYRDRTTALGFDKEGTRATKVAWVDFDQDNRLDLYITGQRSPNQLFQQRPNEKFENIASDLGLDFKDSYTFEWFDADNDGDQDLLVARANRIELYTNQSNRFKLQWSAPTSGLPPEKLTLADYDRDSDLDVFVASPSASQLLVNAGNGQFSAVTPASVGLPSSASTANWVDYDNDGWVDLHVVPGQLYRQQPDGRFQATSLLKDDFPTPPLNSTEPNFFYARASWLDIDNNGTRDGLSFVGDAATLYHNRFQQNHWLQVKLVGTPGNRQAIGAKVIVETIDGRQLQQVGNADGSHYSQGHYRLYFGLGQQAVTRSVHIVWPDGTRQQLSNFAGDQLLTVQHPSNSK